MPLISVVPATEESAAELAGHTGSHMPITDLAPRTKMTTMMGAKESSAHRQRRNNKLLLQLPQPQLRWLLLCLNLR
jgi:hypothetical protein